MADKDRKTKLRDSMETEKEALNKRFDMVDHVMQERPGGLLNSTASNLDDRSSSRQPLQRQTDLRH